MLVRNLRTGVESELREGVARAMIKLGKVEEVKPVVEKEEEKPKPEQKKETPKQQAYRTKDIKIKD